MIGYAFCGSFCTHKAAFSQLIELRKCGYDVLPIMSETVYKSDTRFGKCIDLRDRVTDVCGREIVHTIIDAEPLGPQISLDALVICPCTGNTLAKMAHGITDTSVTMAAKAHLRCNRPLVIALASNDALSANLQNISQMLNRKCVYFVPLSQDDPVNKPHSLVADFACLRATLEAALHGEQYQKVFM